MNKNLISLFVTGLILHTCFSAKAQMGNSNAPTVFHNVAVTENLSSDSELARILRNKTINTQQVGQDGYFADDTTQTWRNTEGWIQHGRDDNYASYWRNIIKEDNPYSLPHSDIREISYLMDTTSQSPEYHNYRVDCSDNRYFLNKKEVFNIQGYLVSENEPIATNWRTPQNNFEQNLVNKVCALGK